jgi:epoxyqueuosine reductase
LTIELEGAIPLALRDKIGNRVFGCDDCQLICPWNKFAKLATINDFDPRHDLDKLSLLQLWAWDETTFLGNTEGSPLRRTGYQNFMRNVAVALGNAPFSEHIIEALIAKRPSLGDNAQHHIDWALANQYAKQQGKQDQTKRT